MSMLNEGGVSWQIVPTC